MRAALIAVFVGAAILLGPAATLPDNAVLPAPQAQAKGKLSALESGLKGLSGGSGGKPEAALILLFIDFMIHVAPHLLFPREPFYYQDYPYQFDVGYIQYGAGAMAQPGDPVPLTGRAITFELRGSYMIDSPELHSYRVYGKARLSYLFNLDADVTQFWEWAGDTDFDTLTLSKFDGLFNISNSPFHDLDLGFGVSYIDGIDYFGGLNAKITGDIFPVKPLAIHFSGCANVFAGGTLFETECSLGIFLRRFELRLGYRAVWVGDIEIHGPMTGLAIWF